MCVYCSSLDFLELCWSGSFLAPFRTFRLARENLRYNVRVSSVAEVKLTSSDLNWPAFGQDLVDTRHLQTDSPRHHGF
jgi:hypothetical protein